MRLGHLERKPVLLVEFHRRERGAGSTWSSLPRALGIDRAEVCRLVFGLRQKGAVAFTREQASIAATGGGLRAALERERAA